MNLIVASWDCEFSFATSKASSLISLAIISTETCSNSFFSVIAIIPLPVQRSRILNLFLLEAFTYSITLYMSSSVSILGDKTSLVTLYFLS